MAFYKYRKTASDLKARGEERPHVERPPMKKVSDKLSFEGHVHPNSSGMRLQYQPLSAFLILLTPEIFMIFIFASLLYMQFYVNL